MSDQHCIFCQIASGEIPAIKIFETDELVAFDDINPQAPVHFLVIPKKHIPTLDDLQAEDISILGKMLYYGAELARKKGIAADGYRQIINCKESAGQVVFHLHLHIMGGRPMNRMG